MIYTFYLLRNKRKFSFIDIGLLICGVVFLIIGKYIIGVLSILMGILGVFLNRQQKIKVSEKGIEIWWLYPKHYTWDVFFRVILKDDMLTLDFVNNKLFQQRVHSLDNELSESQFNNFCEEQIMLSGKSNGEE